MAKSVPADFCWRSYLIANPSLLAKDNSKKYAIHHWLKIGQFDLSVKYSYQKKIFDANWYLKHYSKEIPSSINNREKALKFYINSGFSKGHRPHRKLKFPRYIQINSHSKIESESEHESDTNSNVSVSESSSQAGLNILGDNNTAEDIRSLNTINRGDVSQLDSNSLEQIPSQNNLKVGMEPPTSDLNGPGDNIKIEIAVDLPRILFITHNWGGGTEYYYKCLAQMFKNDYQLIVLRSQSGSVISLHLEDNFQLVDLGNDKEYADLISRLKSLGIRAIHVNHLINHSPHSQKLIEDLDLPYMVSIHDYYYLSGQYDINRINLAVDFYQLLSKSQLNIVPCRNIGNIYNQRYPDISFETIYHENVITKQVIIDNETKQLIKSRGEVRIAVVGHITLTKGVGYILDLLNNQQSLNYKVYIIGTSTHEHPRLAITGEYKGNDELEVKIKEIDPDILWIPGRVQETYCYVLSQLLKFAKPIVAPLIPTFVERLSGLPGIFLHDPSYSDHDMILLFNQIVDHYPSIVTQATISDPINHYIRIYHELISKSDQQMKQKKAKLEEGVFDQFSDSDKAFLSSHFEQLVKLHMHFQTYQQPLLEINLVVKDLQQQINYNLGCDVNFTADPLIVFEVHNYLAQQLLVLRRQSFKSRQFQDNTRLPSKTAILVEPRLHPLIEVMIRNIEYYLGADWQLQVCCSNGNLNYIQAMFTPIENQSIKYTVMPYENLNHCTYSQYLMSEGFWNQIEGEHILIYQTDSFILNALTSKSQNSDTDCLETYLEYGFVGAPHGGRYFDVNLHTPGNNGMNGGFSLRRKSASLRAIREVPISVINQYRAKVGMEPLIFNLNGSEFCIEDSYYNHAMEILQIPLPQLEIKEKFCIQDIPLASNKRTIAIHGFHHRNYFTLEQIKGIIRSANLIAY